jgi:hypothetical protein
VHQTGDAEDRREVDPLLCAREPCRARVARERRRLAFGAHLRHRADLDVDLVRLRVRRVEPRPQLLDVREVRGVIVLGDVVALELDVPHAIDVDVVLREVKDVERPLRCCLLPRQLDDAAVIQRHDADARQLLGRDVRGAAAAAPTSTACLPATGRRLTTGP